MCWVSTTFEIICLIKSNIKLKKYTFISAMEKSTLKEIFFFVCLSVCLFFVPFYIFSHGDVTITGEGLQMLTYAWHLWPLGRRILRVPNLLWHETSVYNGHLWGHVKLRANAERLAEELSLSVLTAYICCGWDSCTQPSPRGANAVIPCAIPAARRISMNF